MNSKKSGSVFLGRSSSIALLLVVLMMVSLFAPSYIGAQPQEGQEVTGNEVLDDGSSNEIPPAEEGAATPDETPPETSPPDVTPDEADEQEDQSQGGGDFGTLAPGDVGTWDDLRTQIANPAVSVINLTTDIARTNNLAAYDLSEISRSLTIKGNGFQLNFGDRDSELNGFVLSTAAPAGSVFTLENVYINKADAYSDAIGTDQPVVKTKTDTQTNWSIVLQDVRSSNVTTRVSGLVRARAGNVELRGEVNWTPSGNMKAIQARGVTFAADSNVNLTTTNTTVHIFGHASAYFYAMPGAKVNLRNQLPGTSDVANQCIRFDDAVAGSNFYMDGATVSATALSSVATYGDYTGAINLYGQDMTLILTNGAVLFCESLGNMAAFVSNVTNSGITAMGPGTKFIAESTTGNQPYAGTVRFRDRGNQTFNVSNYAEVYVTRKYADYNMDISRIPAIRFGRGSNNVFNVSGGGKVYVLNEGDRTIRDPNLSTSSDTSNNFGDNEGIQFARSGFAFNVWGTDSVIQIKALRGAAVNAFSQSNGRIYVGPGATFIAEGQTASATKSIFQVGGGNVDIAVDRPLYYDFRNNRPDGGLIFGTGATTTFSSIQTDLSVWLAGSNLDYNPYKSWSLFDYILRGQNLSTIHTTSIPSEFNSGTYGSTGMSAYSRMSGNNARMTVDSLFGPTNADRYLRAQGSVQEGLTGTRPVWDNEGFANFLITYPNSTTSTVTVSSIREERPWLQQIGVSMAGVLRHDNGDGTFLVPGTKFKVTRAWRGGADLSSPRVHESLPVDIVGTELTVQDILPPRNVGISQSALYLDKKTLSGTWYSDTRAWNTEDPVKLYAALNSTIIRDGSSQVVLGTLNADHTWSYTLPSNIVLTAGDKVYIVVEDSAGNATPLVQTPVRDVLVPQSSFVTAQEFPLQLLASDVAIGLPSAQAIENLSSQGAIYNALKQIINARVVVKPSMTWGGSMNTVVINVSPAFAATTGAYTVTYAPADDITYTNTATVMVYPSQVDPTGHIMADDFNISVNSATALLGKAPAARNAELILRAAAKGSLEPQLFPPISSFSPDNVTVAAFDLQATQDYVGWVKFEVKGHPEWTVTIKVRVGSGKTPVLLVSSPVSVPLHGSFNAMGGVTAYDEFGGTAITDRVTYSGIVNVDKIGTYQVTYSVTNDDSNTATATRNVWVGPGVVTGPYILYAHSFVVKRTDASASQILVKSGTEAWYQDPLTMALSATDAAVKSVSANFTAGAITGDYPITVAIKNQMSVEMGIFGKVVDKDVLNDGKDPATNQPYAIGGNNVTLRSTEAALFTGTTQEVYNRLISRAAAEGWTLGDTITSAPVTVLNNGIVNPQVGQGYQVTFCIQGVTNVTATVTFTIDNGNAPVITGAKPLVVERTTASALMSNAEIMASLAAVDIEDTWLSVANVSYQINGPIQQIDKRNIGVYSVSYSVTDSHNNTTVFTRAIVVTDGRYVIPTGENIIIGARNFVVQSSGIQQSEGEVRSASYAEAFTKEGTPLTVALRGGFPAGYQPGAIPGDYWFTWGVDGYVTYKQIKGIVVNATAVDNGERDSSYAIVASDFSRNTSDAGVLASGPNAGFVTAASVQVYKLVDGVPDVQPQLNGRGSYSPNNPPQTYPLTFFASFSNYTNRIVSVTINGTVNNGNPPVLNVATPYVITRGGAYNVMTSVSATDIEDDAVPVPVLISHWAIGESVDANKVGIYRLGYMATDSDYNTAGALRAVLVNDGRYVPGEERILFAKGFVAKKSEVTTIPSNINTDILDRSKSMLYDGRTGAEIGAALVSQSGLYRAEVGLYNIVISGLDKGSSFLSKGIQGEVVDRDKLVEGPVGADPKRDATWYIFANDLTLSTASAGAIVNSPTSRAALAEAALAGARRVNPDGSLTPVTAVTQATNLSATQGSYTATLAVQENTLVTLQITIQVTNNGVGPEIHFADIPLVIPMSTSAGVISNAQLLQGVTVTDDWDQGLQAVVTGGPVTIPANAPSLTKVTYYAVDSDGNPAVRSRAVIVNDGSFKYDTSYVVRASSFLIGLSQVTPQAGVAQILSYSGAQAWTSSGDPAVPIVTDPAGYKDTAADYFPKISVDGYTSLWKSITAKVVDDTDTVVTNGAIYSLRAREFRINVKDAQALAALDHNSAAYKNTFLTRSNAQSYLRGDDNFGLGGTPILQNDGGFSAIPESTFTVRIAVLEEPATYVDVRVLVSNAAPPTLYVPPYKVVTLGAVFGEAQYMDGVYATDDYDAETAITITHDSPVNTAAKGLYTVTYVAKDTDENYTTKTGIVAVDWTIEDDYAFDAHSFVRKLSEVPTGSALLDNDILSASGAQAFYVADGSLIPTAAAVKVNGNYQAAVGDYPITLGPANHNRPLRTITGKVVDRQIVEEGVETVSATEGAARYYIAANNIVIRTSQAQSIAQGGANAVIDAISGAAWKVAKNATGDTLANKNVTLLSDGGFITANAVSAGNGVWTVRLAVDEARSVYLSATIQVGEGNQPVITVNGNLSINKVETPLSIMTRDEIMTGVTATDPDEGDITSRASFTIYNTLTSTSQTAIDKYYRGIYSVTYYVTDSDGLQAVPKSRIITVGYRDNFPYIIDAFGFVKTVDEALGTDEEIKSESGATAWLVNNNGDGLIPKSVTVTDRDGYKAEIGEYNIVLTVTETVDTTRASIGIVGKVIDKDVIIPPIVTPTEPGIRYTIGGNHVQLTLDEAPGYSGLSTAVKNLLISRAAVEGWKITESAMNVPVDVASNGIPASPQPGATYPAIFYVAGVPDAAMTLIFSVNNGNVPVISGAKPLVLTQTALTHDLSDAEIKASLIVSDAEDGANLTIGAVSYTIAGGLTKIDQHNIGVYRVTYNVTDSHGNNASFTRAIVVTDGRYIIDQQNDLIIGARNFVIAAKDVQATESQVRSKSYAEAFDLNGVAKTVQLQSMPANYAPNCPAADYNFTWIVAGYPVTKTITGTVSNAQVVDPGGKDSSYALTANHFKRNTSDAAVLESGPNQGFYDAANVTIVKLVPGVADKTPRIIDKGNFSSSPAVYTLSFGASGMTDSELRADVKGEVTNGETPVLNVTTPIEISVGAVFNALGGVTASDLETPNMISRVTWAAVGTPLDVNKVGLYTLLYSATDGDNNTVTARRVVVVNDGRFIVGSERVLFANAFVTKLADVTSNPANIDREILDKSWTRLYDGETGALIDATSVLNDGSYHKAVGEYTISVQGVNLGSSMLTKSIKGQVVDADVIEVGPPGVNPENGDTYSIYAKNSQLTISGAQALLSDGRGLNAAVIENISAGARKSNPDGSLSDQSVKVLGFSPAFAATTGAYTVTLADASDHVTAAAVITVATGTPPAIILTTPLVIPITSASVNLTNAQLLQGVSVVDDEPGLVASILGTPVIPANVPSLTKVGYTVQDSDGNSDTKYRAVIVDDGSFIWDDNYILGARSFLIGQSEVDVTNANNQIVSRSEAVAMRTNGDPATPYVVEFAGYKASKDDYKPKIGISGYADLSLTITARVYDDGNGGGTNGAIYSLLAYDYRINMRDAAALVALGKNSDAYKSDFITRSQARSFLRADNNLAASGTPVLANDGGFAAIAETSYTVRIAVSQEMGTYQDITVRVSDATPPKLQVPPFKYVSLGGIFGNAQYEEGVLYWDNESAEDELVLTYNKPVNVSVKGLYQVDYKVADPDDNETTASGVVSVDVAVDPTGYAVDAYSFVRKLSDVPTSSALLHPDIISASEAYAAYVGGGTIVSTPAAVRNDDGYTAATGIYDVSIGVNNGAATPAFPIQAAVVDRNVLVKGETGGGVSVGGTRYYIGANSINLRVSEAKTVANGGNNALISAVSGSAWKVVSQALGNSLTNVPVTVITDGGFVAANTAAGTNGSYTVRLAIGEAQSIVLDAIITVGGGGKPVISVSGDLDLAKSNASHIMTRNEIMSGVTANDPGEDGDLTDAVVYTIFDARSNVTVAAIDTYQKGIYRVVYNVTDSDGIAADPKTRNIIIGYTVKEGYLIEATSFVKIRDEVLGTDAEILDESDAKAWYIADYSYTPKSVLVTGKGGYTASVGAYTIELTVAETVDTTRASINIEAQVKDKDVIEEPITTNGGIRYTIGGNHVTLELTDAPNYVGLTDAVKARLISAAAVEGWILSDTAIDTEVDVLTNGIVNPVAGQTYQVTFYVKAAPESKTTLNFGINYGNVPVISGPRPLVVTQTAVSHPMTADEIKAGLTVNDIEDGTNLTVGAITYTVAGGLSGIDQRNINVYKVTYSVVDSHNNRTNWVRSIIVTDGRYEIDPTGSAILGARNFVIQKNEVQGTEEEARTRSFAEAFDFDGTPLSVQLSAMPPGYVAKADKGDYSFTWIVSGKNLVKTIFGKVTDADVVDPGGKDSSYALTANHFLRNISEAAVLESGPNQGFYDAANVTVHKLVPGVADRAPRIIDKAGYSSAPAVYQLQFGIVGMTDSDMRVRVNGTVSQGNPPILTVSTPVEITKGSFFNPMQGVTATDIEDDLNQIPLVVSYSAVGAPVDTSVTGRYEVFYSVEDSDGNPATATRIVVVNDGRYVVGSDRILFANSFVTKLENVTEILANRDAEILDKSSTRLYDGETNALITGATSVPNNGNYHKAAFIYNMTIMGVNNGSSNLYKNITGEVVDADEIFVGPPVDPENGDSHYLYGNNLTLRISEAQDLISDARGLNAAIIDAAAISAKKSNPDGTLSLVGVTITGISPAFAATVNNYTVSIADVNGNVAGTLNIAVVNGYAPEIRMDKPLIIPITSVPGLLTDAQLLSGVTVYDEEQQYTLSASLVSNPGIAANIPSMTRVSYTVTDSENNTVTDHRLVIVQDGSIIVDPVYSLKASSFLIGLSQVNMSDLSGQILRESDAQAMRNDGEPATPYVFEMGGYKNAKGDWKPVIGISGYANLKTTVTARVYDDGDGGGENGAVYSLLAYNYRINLRDAVQLLTNNKDSAAYKNDFLLRSNAQSYIRADRDLAKGGTPVLVSDGGFAASEGAVFNVTFGVAEEPATQLTIQVLVSDATPPNIYVPPYKYVTVGSVFGPTQYEEGVYCWDNEDPETDLVLSYTTPVNTSVKGLYQVVYTVEDLDGNKTTAGGVVSVGIKVENGYSINGHSFVTSVDYVTGTHAEILAASEATATYVGGGVIVPTASAVKSDGGYTAVSGYYDITLGVANASTRPAIEITAIVVEKDVIVEVTTPGGFGEDDRYFVGGNNIILRLSEAKAVALGGNNALIEALSGAAWKVTDDQSDLIDQAVVIVTDGGFTAANATSGTQGTYSVKLGVAADPGVQVPLTIQVVDGNPPAITVDGILEYEWTSESALLTRDDLMTSVSAIDPDEGEITTRTAISIKDSDGVSIAAIDKNNPGVYQVTYDVTDSDGNEAVPVERSVVINDGRYIVVEADELILGAKDYQITKGAVTGTDSEVLNLSFAEAYDFEGKPINTQVRSKGMYAMGVPVGDYPMTIGVPISISTTTKAITAHVTDFTIIDTPDPDKKYSIGGNPVRINLTDALTYATMQDLIDQVLQRSGATVTKLVSTQPDSDPVVIDLGGMAADLGSFNEGASYTVRIAVDLERGTYIDVPVLISDGEAPQLLVTTPLNISVGAVFNEMGGVTVTDKEDGLKGINLLPLVTWEVVSGGSVVDTSTMGAFYIKYSVTDSDHNTSVAYRTLLVGDWKIGKEYALFPGYFTANVMAISGDSSEIIAKSGTYAVRIADFTRVPVIIIDTNDYGRKSGNYNVIVAVAAEPDLIGVTKAKITANTYTVTFDGNGGYLSGPRTLTVTQPNTRLAYMPSQPGRVGYTFLSWNFSPYGDSGTFSPYSDVTMSYTVYAQWQAIPVPEPTPPPTVIVPPPTVIIPPATPPTVVQPTIVTVPVIVQPSISAIDDNTDVPLADTPQEAGWSLINLLCALLSIGLMVAMILSYFASKRVSADLRNGRRRDTVDLVVALIGIAASVVSVVVLFMTQDFNMGMEAVDNYTIVMALVLLIQIVSPFLKALKKDESEFLE